MLHVQAYLTLSHSERPKLYGVLAILSAVGLSCACNFLKVKKIIFDKLTEFLHRQF